MWPERSAAGSATPSLVELRVFMIGVKHYGRTFQALRSVCACLNAALLTLGRSQRGCGGTVNPGALGVLGGGVQGSPTVLFLILVLLFAALAAVFLHRTWPVVQAGVPVFTGCAAAVREGIRGPGL